MLLICEVMEGDADVGMWGWGNFYFHRNHEFELNFLMNIYLYNETRIIFF